ncbi:MAG: hypothetical protein HY727_19645 [Candidatus Rokubacteria bacterium]|nr:hypothetical protein [Candidatus Rokubacteria bacterium]
MNDCRAQIVTTYAGWTVLSALHSSAPVKSRERVYPLLRSIDFARLLRSSRAPITPPEFAQWHRAATLGLCAKEARLSVGWASKMVNVYLKTAGYVGGLGRPGLTPLLHPPLDAGLWTGLRRRFSDCPDLLAKTHAVRQIKAIRDYATYETIIAGCREAATKLGGLLIEVEQLWEGADFDSQPNFSLQWPAPRVARRRR